MPKGKVQLVKGGPHMAVSRTSKIGGRKGTRGVNMYPTAELQKVVESKDNNKDKHAIRMELLKRMQNSK